VLAAIAVLALVYTALARAAMQGLAHEGDASRRLRASLLADRFLGEIEAGLEAGVAPPIGLTETEEEEYAISVDVRPSEVLGEFAAATAEQLAAVRRAPGVGEAPQPQGGPSLQLLVAPPGAPPPLREIEVTVRWLEGADEQQVTRTTFAADPAIVSAALGSLSPSDAGAGGDGDQGGDGRVPDPNAGMPSPSGDDESE
jgi:hypothetical protein